MKRPITRLFIANRGKIPIRIVAACRKLGIEAVVGVSEGVQSTLPFHRALLAHPDFEDSRITTQWIEQDFCREVYGAQSP